MKKMILFVMVLGLSLISAHSIRAFEFKDQPIIEDNSNCAPLTSLTVTLKNDPAYDVCAGCATWYISLYEWDGSTTYRLIGSAKTFLSGPTYSWSGVNWDDTNYPYLVLVWHYVNTGGGGCGYSTPDQYLVAPYPTTNPWLPTDFWPC